ncbi:MAG: ribosome maturation factor RimP [Acutalibacter sp.]
MSALPKKKGNVAQRVWQLSQPLAQELGLSLWDVQFVKEGADWFLRVFIDKEGGVSIDDCVDMTHALSPVLDKEDPIPQEYLLEVSSPGIDRKLTRPEHFAAYVGRPVSARLIRPLEDGSRELTGILIRAEEDGTLELQLDEDTSVTLEKKECSSIHSVDEDFDEE